MMTPQKLADYGNLKANVQIYIAVVTLVRTLKNSENVQTLDFVNGSTQVAMAINTASQNE